LKFTISRKKINRIRKRYLRRKIIKIVSNEISSLSMRSPKNKYLWLIGSWKVLNIRQRSR
jgi:hypothetical protein